MILKIMGRGFLWCVASPSAQGGPQFFCGLPQFFCGPPRLSWAVGLLYRLLRPALRLRASQPVFLHTVTQLLRVHTQQRGRTMHTRDPPVGRLQGL